PKLGSTHGATAAGSIMGPAASCPKSARGRKALNEHMCPVLPQEQTSLLRAGTSASCHVWTAPRWQGFSSRLQAGRCSHVFGLLAAHKAAGHNALRGSGPGQKPAFEDALAQVGCPDRRIGRLCITCCSPSQPSHHANCRRDLGYTASATGSL